MRYSDIKRHLRPYLILDRRKTTINHAFAAAIAPCDAFDDRRVREAIALLGQDPDSILTCVYCDAEAETWDHVFAIVERGQFGGRGHRLGNLLPCCKPCNSRKGNKDWKSFLLNSSASDPTLRIERIERYLQQLGVRDRVPDERPEYQELQAIKTQILDLMKQADHVARRLRDSDPLPPVS